jgi:hypothetical protein
MGHASPQGRCTLQRIVRSSWLGVTAMRLDEKRESRMSATRSGGKTMVGSSVVCGHRYVASWLRAASGRSRALKIDAAAALFGRDTVTNAKESQGCFNSVDYICRRSRLSRVDEDEVAVRVCTVFDCHHYASLGIFVPRCESTLELRAEALIASCTLSVQFLEHLKPR